MKRVTVHKQHIPKACIKDALYKAEMLCQDRELRFTELRRSVLQIIWENQSPAKAYDILHKLEKNLARAKPPTVYRSLNFLLEHGLVHKLNSLNAYIHCHHPLRHRECYFLICSDCGIAKECCNDQLAQAIISTTSQNKFQARYVAVEIQGRCLQCVKNIKLCKH